MTGPIKADLDRRMLRTLKAMARRRGEDHDAVELPHWVNHDLRRTVRSGLSALRVPHNVAEAILAHRPPGIVGTYDLHQYLDEKREALEAWAQRIASIVNPSLPRPPRSSSCRGGGDDRLRPNRQRGLCQRWARLPVARLANPFKTGPWRGIAALNSMLSKKEKLRQLFPVLTRKKRRVKDNRDFGATRCQYKIIPERRTEERRIRTRWVQTSDTRICAEVLRRQKADPMSRHCIAAFEPDHIRRR